MIVEPDFLDFIRLLNKHKVEYLVIGGYAMAAYNNPRFTKDLDIWIKRNDPNADKMLRVIEDFGFGNLKIEKSDFLNPARFIQLGLAPVRIDIATEISGTSFEDAYLSRNEVEVGNIMVPVIGIDEFIKNKLASARKQDIADAERLQKARKDRKKK
jgi:hypothetical protein